MRAVIARLMRDRVTITRPAGADAYGQPTPGASVTVDARVVREHVRSVTPAGEEFVSGTQIATFEDVTVGDTITLHGVAHRVRAVKRASTLDGSWSLTEAHL
jgi:hypothetical protein